MKSRADEPPPSFQWLCLSRKTKLGEIIAAQRVFFFFFGPHSPSQACGEIQEGVGDARVLAADPEGDSCALLCCVMSMPCLIGEQSDNLTSSGLIPPVPPSQRWANRWMKCFGDAPHSRKNI